ncbi:MAG: putative metal-dependent hydrolase [Bacteroidetes bacterium]|jgi:uncharacterized damage-inducible protein DinB|nr:putative metal-dependent hydrolase [Bacteroidota bacterium]
MSTLDPRYPVGKFAPKDTISQDERTALIRQIEEAPERLAQAVAGLTEIQLDTPYRDGGWTVRQVVHHLADSHMNAYIRFRLAVTEDNPTVKPYNEKRWSELIDSRTAPIDLSISIIEALHARWAMMLESFTSADFERRVQHPENGPMDVDRLLQLYAWHGRHHCAHVTELRRVKGW